MDRITRRTLALSPTIVLGGLAVVSVVIRAPLALRHKVATYWPDEYIYAGLSRSIGHGHLTVHGDTAHFPALLQPLLAAPFWRFFSLDTAYQFVQLENAVAASLVVVPIYLLARYVGLERWQGYVCAVYALVLPTLVWIPVTISDFIAYPLAIGAIAAAVRTVDRPSPRGQCIFLALTLLATLARVQYFVIAIAYLVAALWLDRRVAVRKHAIAFASLVPVILSAGIGALGFYNFSSGSFSWSTLTWIPLQAYLLAIFAGGVIVPGAVAALIRPRQRAERAFALVVSVVAVGILAEVSVIAAQEGRFRERYLFVLSPLVAVSFFLYLKRGRPHGRLVFALAAALAGAAAYLPVTRYSKAALSYDSESMVAVNWLQGHTSTTAAGLIVAVGMTIGAALALLTRFRSVAFLGLPVAIAVSILITIPTMQFDIKTHARSPEGYTWIDRAVGQGEQVTLIATPSSSRVPMLDLLYWNKSLNRELVISPVATDNYSKTRLHVTANGTTTNLTRYFVYNRQGTHATIRGVTLVKRVDDFLLYRATSAAAPRIVDVVKGQLSNGFISPYTEIDVWGSGTAKHATFTLSRPAKYGTATIFIGKQKFKIKRGATAGFTCTSTHSPFEITVRSLSEIPDEFDRPVIAKMTGLRAVAAKAAPARPGCIRLPS
jgi:hypothetical protein